MRIPSYNPQGSSLILQRSLRSLQRTLRLIYCFNRLFLDCGHPSARLSVTVGFQLYFIIKVYGKISQFQKASFLSLYQIGTWNSSKRAMFYENIRPNMDSSRPGGSMEGSNLRVVVTEVIKRNKCISVFCFFFR